MAVVCKGARCDNPAMSRGVCRFCYSAFYRLVSLGFLTWETAEGFGWVLPAKETGRWAEVNKRRRESRAQTREMEEGREGREADLPGEEGGGGDGGDVQGDGAVGVTTAPSLQSMLDWLAKNGDRG